jgi:hypothetical protein
MKNRLSGKAYKDVTEIYKNVTKYIIVANKKIII